MHTEDERRLRCRFNGQVQSRRAFTQWAVKRGSAVDWRGLPAVRLDEDCRDPHVSHNSCPCRTAQYEARSKSTGVFALRNGFDSTVSPPT